MSLSRRRLLQLAGSAAAAWAVRPWPVSAPAAAQNPAADPLVVVPTLEAFADTLIPGEKRTVDDRTVAGAADGPGAVHAGAVDLLFFPGAGTDAVAPGFAAGLNLRATEYAARHQVPPDPTVPPFVALDFDQRTELCVELLDGDDPDQALWEAVAALVFLSFHTAGHLPTAEAVRAGHPGLAWLDFPAPDADGLWRFSSFSYRRALAREHPQTTAGGHPA
jgi:enediyne biosynthesis protein E8